MKKTWLVGLIFGVLFLLNNAGLASAMELDVDKIDYGYLSEVGRSYTRTFVIKNDTEEKIAVKLSTKKASEEKISEESKKASDWIAFVGGVKYFEIPAGETHTVGLRVIVPSDASFGSQYAKIKVEDATSGESKELDVRMTVATDGVAFGGELSGVKMSAITLSDKLNTSMVVKNSGNAGFAATYTVRYSPKFGLEDWKDAGEASAEIYPGSEIELSVDDIEIGYGLYKVEQKVNYVNANGEQVEEVSLRTALLLPSWAVIACGVVVAIIIVLIVVVTIIRKRKDEDQIKPKTIKKK